jgi:hypothetical protein
LKLAGQKLAGQKLAGQNLAGRNLAGQKLAGKARWQIGKMANWQNGNIRSICPLFRGNRRELFDIMLISAAKTLLPVHD